jgi:hypothetical protein
MRELDDFLFPHSPFRGEASAEAIVFDANLQEFAQKVSYICNLQNGGKLDQVEAYNAIKALWKELKHSKKQMDLGD